MKQTPKSLTHSEAKKLWRQIASDYELEPDHHALLEAACHCWQRICEARDDLDKHGHTFMDRYNQPKPRPEAEAERKNKNLFRLLMRELGLDLTNNNGDFRPPRQY